MPIALASPGAPSNEAEVENNAHAVTMSPNHLREQGLESFRKQAWTDAAEQLSAADREDPLDPEDLIRLGMAAYLIGHDDESIEVLTRAHQRGVSEGDIPVAVRSCFWIGFQLINRGDMAQAGGWFGRGGRMLEENDLDCVERGYLLIPVALQNLYGGDFETSFELFNHAREIGERFADVDLTTLARLGRGQALVGSGEIAEGIALLDEVMIHVTTGEVSAIIAGLVYCAVISVCFETFDLRRADEWTGALTRWCDAQPDLAPYRGQCLVHRSQILQFRGKWHEAFEEAELARDRLLQAPDRGAAGLALYELGELHRLRGDFDDAEVAYRESNQWGHEPQPGLARLRLAQGQTEVAAGAIRRVADEATDPSYRYRVLPAYVEIMLADGDVAAAEGGADELLEIAARFDLPVLQALARHARGAVLLSQGDGRAALVELRAALTTWQELDAPYEAAVTQTLMGLACRAIGDRDSGDMALDSARLTFERLGALPDLARVEELLGVKSPSPAEGLTGREIEVLALVATGKTNRDIGSALFISDKTVARHVSNIFIKLGVTSRAAATAYAFKHGLA